MQIFERKFLFPRAKILDRHPFPLLRGHRVVTNRYLVTYRPISADPSKSARYRDGRNWIQRVMLILISNTLRLLSGDRLASLKSENRARPSGRQRVFTESQLVASAVIASSRNVSNRGRRGRPVVRSDFGSFATVRTDTANVHLLFSCRWAYVGMTPKTCINKRGSRS